MRKLLTLMTALIAAMAFAGCSSGGGGGVAAGPVGPVDSLNGFPTYYRDPNGLTLALCDDPLDPLCIADPVVPGNTFSAQTGFGSEAFWWYADAKMTVNSSPTCTACADAILVMGLEATFGGTGIPAAGQQIAFSRLRIRIDAPVAGQYTVTHPYGLVSFLVTTPGVVAINSEVGAPIAAGTDTTNGRIGDIGCLAAPCDFNLAFGGATFPFLVWDPAVVPAAPAGYIGNPALPHEVTGSPAGNNVFRVQGPAGSDLDGLGGTMIETKLFSVQGKRL